MGLIAALVLVFLLPHPWNYVGFAAGLLVFAGELGFWNRKVRGQKEAVGAATLIGASGTVVTACRPTGQVRIDGELWAARCEEGADVGDKVTVSGRDGLTLLVSR
jgi:membrane protein implicated in regulation of membrane protease activity